MARKSKFDKIRRKAILDALKVGATYEVAAESAGISRSTLSHWIVKGKKESKGPYKTFLTAVKKAESQGAISALQTIELAMHEGNWNERIKAAVFMLERRHGMKRDAQHQRSDHIGEEVAAAPTANTPIETMKEQAQQIRKAIAKAEAAESWQAYSALQRQLLSVMIQIQQISTADDRTFDDLTDEQIIGEISTMVTILPPVLKQRLIDEINALESPNIRVLKK